MRAEAPRASRKLHIGGRVRTPGWEVLDAIPAPWVDHVANAAHLVGFPDNTFEAIYASHVLEHFDYKDQLPATLHEWRRVLVPGGTLHVSVPDLDILAQLFVDRSLLSIDDRFLVMRTIFGGHMDEYDYHLTGINEEFLTRYLRDTGFTAIRRVSTLGLFDDMSSTTVKNVPVSLNMLAEKP